MPEFYADTACSYQVRAQPFLDAIARGIRDRADARNFVLRSTAFQASFDPSIPLWTEQWSARDPSNRLKCPFWANYWFNPCEGCTCRLAASVSMEIDALFFLRSPAGEGLAIHVEMKMPREPLSFGQAEAYRPRATCYEMNGVRGKASFPTSISSP